MSNANHRLTDEFVGLLADYLARKEEAVLERAYELGRKAVTANLTVLDMVAIQQDALARFLLRIFASERIAEITKTAAGLFAESLAPFELVQRSSQEGKAVLRRLNEVLERRVAEQTEEIRQERDFARKLIETAQAIILVLDKEGRIHQFNPYMEQVSGYRLEEVRGKDWFSSFLPESDRSRIRQLFLGVLNETDKGCVNPILTKDGVERLIEWSSTSLKDNSGNSTGVLCVGQDITEKTQLQEHLVEKERLAAMSITAAKLVHEIGNPLNGMYLTAQLLEGRMAKMKDLDGAFKAGMERITKEIVRLNQLLREFKSFFASEKYFFKPTSLAAVVEEVLDIEAPNHATCGIRVEQAIPADLPLVMGDAAKLTQAVLNLCKNAVEAMPRGGILSLRASRSEDNVVLEITDTGAGIPPDIDISRPFTTTKTTGSGLGLMIVRQIISAHRGLITYTSDPNKGTVFRLTIPLPQSGTENT
jgi:PAS domain S-box-containing protein